MVDMVEVAEEVRVGVFGVDVAVMVGAAMRSQCRGGHGVEEAVVVTRGAAVVVAALVAVK